MNDDLPPIIPTPSGLYRHYKGNMYEVLGTARHSETRESLTVYRALYGERGLWVRPTAMFQEMVEIDGHPHPRFAQVPGDTPDRHENGLQSPNSRR